MQLTQPTIVEIRQALERAYDQKDWMTVAKLSRRIDEISLRTIRQELTMERKAM